MPPDPHLRPWEEENPPDYGGDNLFTVVIEHNGLFCGLGVDLDYMQPTAAFVDYCNTDTWSILWIEEMLKQLGYEKDDRMHVYWQMPGKDLIDGLMCIQSDTDIVEMLKAVSAGHKTLCLIVDHSNFMKRIRDDVVTTRGPPLAAVSSPSKIPVKATSMPNVVDDRQQDQHDVVDDREQEDDGDSDSDFHDSDYEPAEGDDDLFADNIDKDVNDHNEKESGDEMEDDAVLDDEDINIGGAEKGKLVKKFKEFNSVVDIKDPEFSVGMVFADVKEMRAALSAYSISNRVKVNKIRNEKRRIDAVCKPGCPWMLKASADSRSGGFIVRSYVGKHSCKKSYEVKALTADFLAKAFIDEFRDNQKMDLKGFRAKVRRKFNMAPSRFKLGRARKTALREIHGDESKQFSLLWDYGQELRTANPGSSFFLSTNQSKDNAEVNPKQHLATLYWSYDALKRGFLTGCRPLICVDGCHVKTKFKGVLLTEVGIDPNDCIYPVAMGLVEVECTSSWEWFLTTLKDDLRITNTAPFTIISDKQKGLINAVQKVWPDAEHRFCVRHLLQNYQRAGHRGEILKNDLWAIARSTCIPKYQQHMDTLKADSVTAFQWVEELAPNTWIPVFLRQIPDPDLDPAHQPESMIHRMMQEARTEAPLIRRQEALPESSFVVAARDELPSARPRVTTASSRGKFRPLRARGRGAGSSHATVNDHANNPSNVDAPTSVRGGARGRRRASKRTAEESSSNTQTEQDNTRSNNRRTTYSTAPGSAYHLLFGSRTVVAQENTLPDLNAEAVPEEEIQLTQNAPAE